MSGPNDPPAGGGSGAPPKPALWVVQGADVASGRLGEVLAGPEIRQVEQVAPDVVVLSMSESAAEQLRRQFPDLLVEANAGLTPFG
jgi:hypothetical protein